MTNPITIDFYLDDSWASLSEFYKLLVPILNSQSLESWSLDLSLCGYLGPDAAAIIATAYHIGKARGQKPQVVLPTEPLALKGFCQFVGLQQFVGDGSRPSPDNRSSETVPLRPFFQAIANAEAPITKLIKRHFSDLSDDAADAIGVAINEVLNNTIDHAASPCGAYMCARYFTNQRDVRVSIVDMGEGVATTLSKKFPDAADSMRALEMVFEGGYSSRSKPHNMGLGVSNLAKQVCLRRGELIVASGSAVGRIDRGKEEPRFENLPYNLPGTAVFFRMNVDDTDD